LLSSQIGHSAIWCLGSAIFFVKVEKSINHKLKE
jgi:hypothetical protein